MAESVTINNPQPGKNNFLAMADIHFDPFFSCDYAKLCPLIEKLQDSPVTQWSKIFAQYDVKPPKFGEDANFPLLKSSLSAAKKAADDGHAQFVLLLGDSLGHEFRDQYIRYSRDNTLAGFQSFTRKTLAFLTAQLAATFPSIDVYTVVGNNDSYLGDYATNPDGLFFRDAATLWSSLIKNTANKLAMQKHFLHAGYYSILLPNAGNLRLIVLNSNLFSYKAVGKNLDKIAIQELNWLHTQLQAAKANHENVFIAMHIPEGVDFYATLRTRLFRLITLWKSQYVQRFQAELNQFAPQITGIFAAHLHSDSFQVLDFDTNEILLVGVTSISPIFGNNPGFKMCSYSTNPPHLDDFVTYSYPIHDDKEWVIGNHFKYS